MKVETIADVLSWTEEFHRYVGDCLNQASHEQKDERARLLIPYLVDHERQLTKLVKEFRQQAEPKVLHSWCVEYFDERQPFDYEARERAYAHMNAEELFGSVMEQHDEVIDLYRYVAGRGADTPEVSALIEELLQMEEHETQRMAQAYNRLQDM